MSHNLKKAITEAWHAAWDKGDVSVFDQLTDENYRRKSAHSGGLFDLEAIKTEILGIRAAMALSGKTSVSRSGSTPPPRVTDQIT